MLISPDCTVADYSESAILTPDCYRAQWSDEFLPDGVQISRYSNWSLADPTLQASGDYESYEVATPQQWIDAVNADRDTDDARYAEMVAEPLGEFDRTIGDYLTADNLRGTLSLSGQILVRGLATKPTSFAGGENAIQDARWHFTVEGDELTVVFDMTNSGQSDFEQLLPGIIEWSWIVPGDVIETNGRVQGNTITWDPAGKSRFFATFDGLDQDTLDAISDYGWW
jgi:hypothetical protein